MSMVILIRGLCGLPTELLSYLPTPKTPRTATRVGVRGAEEGSPTRTVPCVQRETGKRGSVGEIEKVGGEGLLDASG